MTPYKPYAPPILPLVAPRHFDPYWAFLAITLLGWYAR